MKLETLEGSFSAVSTPIFCKERLGGKKALDEIYKFHILLVTLIFKFRKNVEDFKLNF